jgi:hypothetical protein
MAPRLELQALLVDLLESDNVHFQPPPTLLLSYPCILYRIDERQVQHADDRPYTHAVRYQVTHITRDPDSPTPEKIMMLPSCSFERAFTTENLYHEVFNLFF